MSIRKVRKKKGEDSENKIVKKQKINHKIQKKK